MYSLTIILISILIILGLGALLYYNKRTTSTLSQTGGGNDPKQTNKFTPEDVIKNNIPIASISKLVLACIYKMYNDEDPNLLSKNIVPFEDVPYLSFNIDELLHMKGGIPFSCGGNKLSDVLSKIAILKDYTTIHKPITYSNVTFMLLAYYLEELVGHTYKESLNTLCNKLNLKHTWSCSLWKPGSGDIVTTEEDILKIGKYVQKNFDWFADDLNGTCYRGRGIDVISSNTKLLHNTVEGDYIIKDGSQRVPMVSQINFAIDDVPAKYYEKNEIKHVCRLLIPRAGKVKFQNSLTDIHPFTYPLIPTYRTEFPTFDPHTSFCVDLFGSSIEVGERIEVLNENSYKVFNYTDFDTLPLPNWANIVDVTSVTFVGREGSFDMQAVVEILYDRFLKFSFDMPYLGELKHFHPIFVVDNIKDDVVYLISPFEYAERPYAKLERKGLKITWYTP